MESCAAGQYNDVHVAYGQEMKRLGLRNLILRIGWEWDGRTTGMSVNKDINKAPSYAACFRQVVTAIRRGCDDCQTMFDYNSTTQVYRHHPLLERGYPGDDYVDIISAEGYDNQGPQGNPEGRWAVMKRNLDYVRDFAKARGKYMAIPEWGIWNTDAGAVFGNDRFNGGGDNPYHIQKICEYAKDPANKVYYLIYFNGSNEFPWHDLRRNPRSMAAYKQYCHH